jgi:hypothetical protein
MLRQNKLDCLSLASFFVIVYDFWVRLYLRCARSKGRLLALLANIKLSRKKLARYKHSSLFVRGMSDEEKKILGFWQMFDVGGNCPISQLFYPLDTYK